MCTADSGRMANQWLRHGEEGRLSWSPVVRLLQLSNAPCPMLFTESGMVSETIWGHAHSFWGKPVLYAKSVMLVVPDGTLTWAWQP